MKKWKKFGFIFLGMFGLYLLMVVIYFESIGNRVNYF